MAAFLEASVKALAAAAALAVVALAVVALAVVAFPVVALAGQPGGGFRGGMGFQPVAVEWGVVDSGEALCQEGSAVVEAVAPSEKTDHARGSDRAGR